MVGTGTVALLSSSFLASAVETVEALTIVLAIGVTRGWRSTVLGIGAALAAVPSSNTAVVGCFYGFPPVQTASNCGMQNQVWL